MEVRKVIYTANAIENLHMQLRNILKTRGHFPSDEATSKLIYVALRNITNKWRMPPQLGSVRLAGLQYCSDRDFCPQLAEGKGIKPKPIRTQKC